MANWSNLRLVVTGYPGDIARFRKAAGALEGRIRAKNSTIFTEEMEFGEGRDLEADGISVFRRAYRRATYLFQGRNTDHEEHFANISRRFPRLAFVLVSSDPNGDSHGSYLLLNGRMRVWGVPPRTREALHMKHYRRAGVVNKKGEVDYDADEADQAEWDAFFEMMDVAQQHWDGAVTNYLRGRPKPATRRRQR